MTQWYFRFILPVILFFSCVVIFTAEFIGRAWGNVSLSQILFFTRVNCFGGGTP